MASHVPLLACVVAVLLGLGVFVGTALPAFADESTGVAIATTVCSVAAVLLGVAGALILWRSRR